MRLNISGSGPLVIKIPGLAGGVELYREEMDAAVEAGFRVAALDNTGDRHDDRARGRLDWDVLSDEVAEATERAGEGPAILWGTSFGCLIALAAAARHPGCVRGLLLAVPPEPGGLPALHRAVVRWALRRPDGGRGARHALTAAMLLLCGWEFAVPTALRRLPGLWRASREAATPYPTFRDKFELLLDGTRPGSAAPALPLSILAGRWDLLTPYAGARRLAARHSRARLTAFGAAGHAVAWARPRRYNAAAIAELRRLTTSPRAPAAAGTSPAASSVPGDARRPPR